MTTLNTTQPASTNLNSSGISYATAQNSPPTDSASTTGSATTSADLSGATSPVQITLSQAGLDFLANTSSTANAYLASAQEALARLDQLAKSGHTTAREQAEEQVNNLKAQMRQLMQLKALMSPKALAQELAQLARQLAAAVAQYTQSGGGDAAVGNAVLAAPQTATQPSPEPQTDTQTQQDTPQAQQSNMDDAGNNTSSDGRQSTTPSSTSNTQDRNNQDFAQAAQGLSDQMKALLEDSRSRLKKQGASPDTDIQAAQNALENIEQIATKI
ncbi:hypothetical protein GOB86_13965 [Acetobacter lambici]|uniref:Uncharacterized protein n=1 Tax=Acetobacter lambici TaxID=1332824 RepID=A0ABT1F460_9PROT|nr:hypothetical protein [Acetobacter lambici]MCP1243927.1 hypothetical protein [Acetobacter lambici]MCP1260005.1 hypothetical protein [Acetobacter lambici]NHO58129.1 hypothetical protein [Acetobacter lambici]